MKILVVHASAGAGHQKAAEYIANGLNNSGLHKAVLIDALDYTYPFFKASYRGIYEFMITYTPWAWGFIFHLIDIAFLLPLVQLVRRIHNAVHCGLLKQFLIEEKFDVIISTHFMPTEISGYLKRTRAIKSKVVTVITDYDVHSIWLAKGVDLYCVATDFTKERLKALGVAEDAIEVTGIPVDEKFTQKRDMAALKQKLSIREDKFSVLIATGSFGLGPIEEIVKKLKDVQALVVCGHNKNLFDRLNAQAQDIPLAKIYPLVHNMDELMAVADCMITKPGGLSVTEALSSHLPMIFFSAIPGQETGNIKVLKENGIGKSDCTIDQMVEEVRLFQADPNKHAQAVEKTKALAKPDAVDKIIYLISNKG